MDNWRKLGFLAVLVMVSVLIEVSLIYFSKRYGGLGFSLSLRPNYESF